MVYDLKAFLDDARSCMREFVQPADIVLEMAPLMQQLLPNVGDSLKPEHLEGAANGYARNAIFRDPNGGLSLFCMVWDPGQWTPVHDHGTWGVVGILQGHLMERNFLRVDPCERADSGIVLRRGGALLLGEGSVTTFVPNPDHIHRTGVPREGSRAVSLHLYGREMSNYHVYDLELGRRTLMELEGAASI